MVQPTQYILINLIKFSVIDYFCNEATSLWSYCPISSPALTKKYFTASLVSKCFTSQTDCHRSPGKGESDWLWWLNFWTCYYRFFFQHCIKSLTKYWFSLWQKRIVPISRSQLNTQIALWITLTLIDEVKSLIHSTIHPYMLNHSDFRQDYQRRVGLAVTKSEIHDYPVSAFCDLW